MDSGAMTTANQKFDEPINELIHEISQGNESVYIKGEFYGYSVNRIVRSYLQTDDVNASSFNSFNFPEPKKKKLTQITDRLSSYLHRGDPISSAKDLRYVLQKLFYDTRDQIGIDYNATPFLRGMMVFIRDNIKNVNMMVSSDRDRAINLRRFMVTLGVLEEAIAS